MKNSEKTFEERNQILTQFKSTFKENNIPEAQLIQFLDANLWNIKDAEQQLKETIEWRKQKDIDFIPVATKDNQLPVLVACRGYKYIDDRNFEVRPGISNSVIRLMNSIGGDCFHKFDKEGHPILIDRTGYHKTKELGSNVTAEEITNFQISANEFLNRVIMPEGCERAGKPIHSETLIFDCSNMSLWQFHMSAMYHLKAIAEILQHYYPETLHRLFIVNAPSAFVVMFKVVKPWLNARTLDKIHVLGSDFQSILLEYIDADSLPAFLGGNCRCEHMPGGCVPMALKKKEKLKSTNENENVPTVYNTDVMKRAYTDKSLCSLV